MVANVTSEASHAIAGHDWPHLLHVLATGLLLTALSPAAACAQQKEPAAVQTAPADGIANLPYARGRTFSTLDDYLAHLETLGAVDLPWWREIRPGVYERVTNMPEAQREVATRAELMRKFGFKR